MIINGQQVELVSIRNKCMCNAYTLYQNIVRTGNLKSLYDVYEHPSHAKCFAWQEVFRAACSLNKGEVTCTILGHNCQMFSVGFIGTYNGQRAFYYITAEHARVAFLDAKGLVDLPFGIYRLSYLLTDRVPNDEGVYYRSNCDAIIAPEDIYDFCVGTFSGDSSDELEREWNKRQRYKRSPGATNELLRIRTYWLCKEEKGCLSFQI